MEKLVLRNHLSPGDIIMLTGAVRDLHRCYPGQYLTDIRTSCEDLWASNRYLTPLDEESDDVRVIECHYPLVHRSNQQPYHFIHGFVDYLNAELGLQIRPTEFSGDVHLSDTEKATPFSVAGLGDDGPPIWVVCAGGKYDFTTKWWNWRRYQEVVDQFAGEIRFVQVGEKGNYHPLLKGAIDLRGRTTLRELVHLMYRASGVLCGVTLHMHLAAAVPTAPGLPEARGAVVIAGGREAPHWEAYPTHHFIHTVGALPCCATGGCWKSRTVPLGDGDDKDNPPHLCVDVVDGLPRCMDMISSDLVIRHLSIAAGLA